MYTRKLVSLERKSLYGILVLGIFLFTAFGRASLPAGTVEAGPANQQAAAGAFTPTTVHLAGADITALGAYQAGNKIFAADDTSGSLIVLDGTNNQVIPTTLSVGGSVYDMAINQAHGKVYVASDKDGGNGKITIVNAVTNAIIKQITPTTFGAVSYFVLGNDEVHGKVYVAFFDGVGVIDASTDTFTLIPSAGAPYPFLSHMGINATTNEIFIPTYNSGLTVINGSTLAVSTVSYPANSGLALDAAVNEADNKVYMTMIKVPGQATMGIAILDRGTGVFHFVGADDLEPLAFNKTSNKLFTGVQVGAQASIIDGATNQLTYVNLGTAGIGANAVRTSTDHEYLVNQQYTVIVDGASKTLFEKIPTHIPPSGGLIFEDVAINQATGMVYALNDGSTGNIMVIRDVPTHLITLRSVGANDGWVRETSETSNLGGAFTNLGVTFPLGDDATKKQYRGILSFNTGASLPDTAVITKVTLNLKQQGIVGGGNPVTAFKGIVVDVKNGTFGLSALQASDFQALASGTYGPFSPVLAAGRYKINVTGARLFINRLATAGGLTQMRLRFKLDDNNNLIANYLSLFSGDAVLASRPQLVIQYYIP